MIAATEGLTTDIHFRASDGFPLAATIVEGTGNGPLALISSATATPRTFYLKFAKALVGAGFRAAMVYDYRGIGGSRVPGDWKQPLRKRQWAELDFIAAIETLDKLAPGHKMVGIGQSFGTQALGLSHRSERFARYLMLSAMSGHWRYTDEPVKVFAMMQLAGVPIAALTGKVPGWIGLGETMPGRVYRDWARWSRSKHYFFNDTSFDARAAFSSVKTPILAIRPSDDVWGTARAEEALLRHYDQAPIERRVVTPAMAGGPIGHLGFFRSRYAETLWPPAIEWLAGGVRA